MTIENIQIGTRASFELARRKRRKAAQQRVFRGTLLAATVLAGLAVWGVVANQQVIRDHVVGRTSPAAASASTSKELLAVPKRTIQNAPVPPPAVPIRSDDGQSDLASPVSASSQTAVEVVAVPAPPTEDSASAQARDEAQDKKHVTSFFGIEVTEDKSGLHSSVVPALPSEH